MTDLPIDTFWGRPFSEWYDIYSLLKFRGNEPKSFKDMFSWRCPDSPQGCMNLAFDLAEARALKYDNPVITWVENILINDRRPHKDKPSE